MARIEELIGLIHNQSLDLTDAQLLEEYADCFNLENKLISEGLIKASRTSTPSGDGSASPSGIRIPKPKISKQQKMMDELMEIQRMLGEQTGNKP